MNRDAQAEREIGAAGRLSLVDTALELERFARERARPGPVETNDRCFPTEIREELADAWNYATWGAQHGTLTMTEAEDLHLALAAAARILDRHGT